jgi:hypothetical protein
MPELPTALYELDGDRFHPTGLTRGPWDPGFQHAGPPAALLARAVERAAGIEPGQFGRLGYDILRPVPLAPHRIATRTLRPGRNVEQIEAVLTDADGSEPLMRLSAWRLRRAPPPCRRSGPSRSPTTPRSTGASSPAPSTSRARRPRGPG